MKPKDYLKHSQAIIKDEFLQVINEENIDLQLDIFYKNCEKHIDQLKPVRLLSERTQEVVKNFIYSIDSDVERDLYLYWLISALKQDDSYVYAYNKLIQIANRDSGWTPPKIKDNIGVSEIVGSLAEEEETKEDNKLNGFSSKLTKNQINNLYKQMQDVFFKTTFENFEDLLTGKNCYPIKWIHKNKDGEANRTSLDAFIKVVLKQTKKVAKTHFGVNITSMKRDDYHKYYVKKFNSMLK